jgi:hypothetical protein
MQDDRIASSIFENSDLLYGFHITDQRLFNKFEFCIKLHLKLDIRVEVARWKQFMKDILYIADYLSKMKVS